MPGRFLAVENENLVVKVGATFFLLLLFSQRDVCKLVGRNLFPSGSKQSGEVEYTHANYFTIFKCPIYDSGSSRDGAILRAITNQKKTESTYSNVMIPIN